MENGREALRKVSQPQKFARESSGNDYSCSPLRLWLLGLVAILEAKNAATSMEMPASKELNDRGGNCMYESLIERKY